MRLACGECTAVMVVNVTLKSWLGCFRTHATELAEHMPTDWLCMRMRASFNQHLLRQWLNSLAFPVLDVACALVRRRYPPAEAQDP